jgi:hypothetical protein
MHAWERRMSLSDTHGAVGGLSMCTLSFIPIESGYRAGMNRDEQFIRPHGLPPRIIGNAIYPHEADGGTWVAVNSEGLTLAILNKTADGPLPAKLRSRGELIPELITSTSLAEVHRRLLEIGFKGLWPFRLVAISFPEREVCEWVHGSQLSQFYYDWEPRHWFSSGMSDSEATRIRTAVVENAWRQANAGLADWLRSLHKSHEPQRGPYSICVHRDDAATVSYSEITFQHGQAHFAYYSGSPCQSTSFETVLDLPLRSTAQLPA